MRDGSLASSGLSSTVAYLLTFGALKVMASGHVVLAIPHTCSEPPITGMQMARTPVSRQKPQPSLRSITEESC